MIEYLCHPLGDLSQDPNFWFYTYPGHGTSKLDLYTPHEGFPVYAMMPGRIESSMWDPSGGGNFIKLKSTENNYSRITGLPLYLRYMHLSERLVNEGDTVQAGDLIGYSGNTGSSTGPHLHLDMSTNGNNPLEYPAIDNNVMNHLIPGYDYEANRVREVPDIDGGPGVPYGDNYYYHLMGSPVIQVTKSSGDTPPEGGIEYNPTAYSNPANAQYRAGMQYEPAINSEYGTRTFSREFMGVYPETLTHLDNNFPLKVLYIGAIREFGENEYGISYGKLYRTWILHQPYQYYNYRTEGATLADFANEWDKLTSVWTSGSRHDKQEAQQKTDWNLDFAQKLYNNIRYGPAYGLTLPETIAAFQCWPWTNETLAIGVPDVRSDMINIAPQPLIPNSGGYYTMYNRTGNFDTARNNPTNPAVISSSEEHTHEERDGAHYFDGLVVVNKSYPMSQAAISAVGGLKSETQSAFNQMKQAWNAYVRTHSTTGSTNMFITSGYRTYADQQTIYSGYPAETRDTYSARPGYSEHHTGYAIDITLASSDPTTGFVATCRSMAEWLEQHCWEYGFILRYPQNKQSITGYIYEPWHFRYVGVENAQKFKGTTMEEYFGIDSKY